MLKVGLVGCGKIADDHAEQILRIAGCEIVGVCDREGLMAEQLHRRFPIGQHFDDLEEMLRSAKPDVVHITTSPEGHFPLARKCLESGCHVYVEKPFTVTTPEAEELIDLAEERGLRITAGHDDQFRNASRRMRAMIHDGYLGGAPLHMESYYCYELSGSYAKALLGNEGHWVRRLPGGLLQNIISHGIARIAEHLPTSDVEVVAHGQISPQLRAMGEREIVDELRVIVSTEDATTGYFTFSSQMRPSLHQFRVFGCKNGLLLDQDQETLVKLPGGRRKSYLEQFVSPVTMAGEYLKSSRTNVMSFLRRDFQSKAGMKFLFESFYEAIAGKQDLPIPYREILLTSRIMDEIFAQIRRVPEAPPATGVLGASMESRVSVNTKPLVEEVRL